MRLPLLLKSLNLALEHLPYICSVSKLEWRVYFSKTLKNIEAGSSGPILFITPENKSYQVNGRIEYHTDGFFFRDMKKWNPEKHSGHAAVVLKV